MFLVFYKGLAFAYSFEMNVLGIETSCDETAVAVVADGQRILSNVVSSQIDAHREFGGVVPEVAARSHIEVILPLVDKAITRADLTWNDIDAIAVSNRPGLLGSLLIGVLTAKTLALTKHKPLYGVDHVVAHTYANWLENEPPQFPLLSLTVSGGHTQLMLYSNHDKYEILGKTRDDAAGEAFDKVAKVLGLPYPGGPSIAKAATRGNAHAYAFPEAKLGNTLEFSFSGLKTAVLRHLQALVGKDYTFPSTEIAKLLNAKQINDTAASFQHAAVHTLVAKTLKAYKEFQPHSVALAGGVAANQELRHQLNSSLQTLSKAGPWKKVNLLCPPTELCTDNAAMVAALGYFKAQSASQQKRANSPLLLEALPTK